MGVMIANAPLASGNRWIGLLGRGRLSGVQYVTARKQPVLDALRRRIEKFVGPRVFDVDVLHRRSDAHIEVRSEIAFTGPPLKFDVCFVVSPNACTVQPR